MEVYQEVLAKGIQDNGWMIQGVFPTEDSEPGSVQFAYTIGLIERGAAAEILMAGLPLEGLHAILNEIAQSTLDNNGIPPATWPLRDGYEAKPVFLGVNDPTYSVGQACNYYKTNRVLAIQYVWPDSNFRYPWDEDYDTRMPQPVGGVGRPLGTSS